MAVRPIGISLPRREEIRKGCHAFELHEKRDAMYRVATFLVGHSWGKPAEMADGLGTLLMTWNQAFYRYGLFDFQKLEDCLARNLPRLGDYRRRQISSLKDEDETEIKDLYDDLLESLRIAEGRSQGRRSPVAAAKALHLLAPYFFPLWDNKIANAYGCDYGKEPAEEYISFCWIVKEIADSLGGFSARSGKSVLKVIDEYNYSKYTQGWI